MAIAEYTIASTAHTLTDLPADPDLDKLLEWTRAFDLWLESMSSEHTRRAYRAAWLGFEDFTHKHPWEVTRADVAQYLDDLRSQGLAAGTQQQRLAALSSFYTYALQVYTTAGPDGRERPLHTSNPVQAIPRPKAPAYHHARYLTADEARALLRAIPRSTVQGCRDYALFLAYLATGRRNSEIRNLRWGDFEREAERIFYRWKGKGTRRRDECPAPVYQAIRDYLSAAKRLEAIKPSAYIFTPLTDRAVRLPNVSVRKWTRNQPLSAREVGRLLKRYARRAGLDPRKIRVHTLRHTAAMLRKQAGDDVEAISAFLAHSSLAVTQIYLHQVEGQTDTSWDKVEALLGL